MIKKYVLKNYKVYALYIYFILTLETIHAQLYQDVFLEYGLNNINRNHKRDWLLISNFNEVQSNHINYPGINSNKTKISFLLKNNGYQINFFKSFNFPNNFYFYLKPNLGPNKTINNHELIVAPDTNQDSISFQLQLSGFGYKNNWVKIQIVRGMEDWGAGEKISLALNHKSETYDYLSIASDYGNIRVKYIHGYLEQRGLDNRYITARGIEWTNKKYFLFGLSESIIYSGGNRSLDIAYLNPIGSHLEIELNERLNILGGNNANAVWQLHLDFLLKQRLRFSGNYLFDEFVIDQDIQKEKEHGKAYSYEITYFVKDKGKYFLNVFLSKIHVGTPTFRHTIGSNNFVTKNRPLGWKYGSDGEEFNYGFSFFKKEIFLFNFNHGTIKIGEESILNRSFETYVDHEKGNFPSGETIELSYLDLTSLLKINQSYFLTLKSTFIYPNFNWKDKFHLSVGMEYVFDKKL